MAQLHVAPIDAINMHGKSQTILGGAHVLMNSALPPPSETLRGGHNL